MMRFLKTAVFAFCLTAFAQAATVPVQNMSPWSLAAEYYGALDGHVALFDVDESSLGVHLLRLHYAPLPFLRFTAGIGGSHSYASPFINGSDVGLSATGGVGLYLPRLLDFLSLTGGYDVFYLKASEERIGYLASVFDEETGELIGGNTPAEILSGRTIGLMHLPSLGVIFHLGRYADLEVGGQYRYFNLSRDRDIERFDIDGALIDKVANVSIKDFADRQPRFYSSLTLHERESGAYLVGGASVALAVDEKDKDKGLLTRVSPYLQIGLIMRDPRGASKDKSEYSDAYIDLKARQDSMADALRRDIERDKQRNREEGRDEHDFEETTE